jgi:gamma-glutamylcyclotransferase (GGCT)/AIG2-like uncharacterized protein YtfP
MSGFTNRVFVYGTLKRGQRNDHYLHAAEFVGHFTTTSSYSMFVFDDYPAVCLHGRHPIRGEIYHVSDEQFRLLDELEWYPDFYQRIEIPTDFGDAWMYIVRRHLCRGKQQIEGVWPFNESGS